MYQGYVKRIKRGFFGPKHVEVYSRTCRYAEPILAEMSRFDDDWHVKTFQDLTASHGDYDDRPARGATAWDAHGEPIADDRDRANYGRGARDQMDPELEEEWAQEMGWMPRAPSAQGVDDDLPF